MRPQKGYYSLIQYCPDLSRGEAANVGVLLFCPEAEFLKAKVARDNRRIRRFFGDEGYDGKRINSIKRGIETRLQKEAPEIKELDDLRRFIALRANQMQITDPKPMKVLDPENDLRELYDTVIGEPAGRESLPDVRTMLEEKLSGAGLEKLVVRNVTVQVAVLEKEMEIPFGFQNGRFNLIKPVRFAANDAQQSVQTSYKYAVTGHSLYRHRDPTWGDLQLIVVGQFRPGDHESPAQVRRVLNDLDVKLYRTEEVGKLISEIRAAGKAAR